MQQDEGSDLESDDDLLRGATHEELYLPVTAEINYDVQIDLITLKGRNANNAMERLAQRSLLCEGGLNRDLSS